MSRAWAGALAAVAALAAGSAAQAAPDPVIAPAAAEVDQGAPGTAPLAYDPWQGVNRGLFGVGMGLDHAVIRPVAHGYMKVTPQPVRNGVSNFVNNLGEPSTAMEDILQGHPKRAGRTTARFVINSTVGVLGLFDVAAHWGMPIHYSDFGQTLGRYGAQAGPYIYLPLIGPTDLRDGVGRVVDTITDPTSLITGPITSTPGATRAGLTALDERASGDGAYRALKDATDPYVTTRSAYTQHRASVVQAASGEAVALPDFDSEPSEP